MKDRNRTIEAEIVADGMAKTARRIDKLEAQKKLALSILAEDEYVGSMWRRVRSALKQEAGE